jgi:hypothetical protein
MASDGTKNHRDRLELIDDHKSDRTVIMLPHHHPDPTTPLMGEEIVEKSNWSGGFDAA